MASSSCGDPCRCLIDDPHCRYAPTAAEALEMGERWWSRASSGAAAMAPLRRTWAGECVARAIGR